VHSPRMKLPPHFEFHAWIDGHGLFLNGRMIALVTQLPNGRARSQRNVGTPHLSHAFHNDVDAGMRFLCAWSTKWRDRIEQVHAARTLGQPPAAPVAAPATRPSAPINKRRRRSR